MGCYMFYFAFVLIVLLLPQGTHEFVRFAVVNEQFLRRVQCTRPMYATGPTHAPISVPSSTSKSSLGAGRRLVADSEMEKNRGEFVKFVKQRSQQAGDMSTITSAEQSALRSLLSIHSKSLSASELSSVAYSVGLMSQNAKDRLHLKDELKHIQHSIPRVSSFLNAFEVTGLLVGMARMDATWKEVCRNSSLSVRIALMLPTMDEKGVGDVVWAVGSMGAKWSDLLPSLQTEILASLELQGRNLNAYALSSALWAMAKMGAKWSYFSDELQHVFYRRIVELANNMSPQQSSKVLWAMGTMGASHHVIPSQLYEQHITNVGKIKRSKMGSAVSASQTLTGVAKTGIPWDNLPVGARPTMWDQLLRVCQSPNDRGIANAIWAMGTLGAPLTAQPKPVQEIMLSAATKVMPECTAWALCNVVWGTAKMGYDWYGLPREFQESLMASVERLQRDMNSVDVGVLVWSLGALDCPLDTLPLQFVEALLFATLTNLEDMRPQELARTIWGLSGSGLSWDSLPASLRWNFNVALRRVGECMGPQDVANCAYGLAILAFDTQEPSDAAFRGAHEVMLNTIRTTDAMLTKGAKGGLQKPMNEQELEQIRIFSHYLKVMNFVTDTRRIPQRFLCSGDGQVDMTSVQGSRLQKRVVKSLKDAFAASELSGKYEITLEVSSFDGVFPTDAVISKNGEIVALLEVDGPHHYRLDGRLRRKDQLKESMYLKRHPSSTFHRVRWDEANKMGSDMIGIELASLVLSTTQDVDPLTAATQAVSKAFNDFIYWGLRNDKIK